MKRAWLGVGFLAVLLILSLGVQMGMGRIHDPMAENLEQAAFAALEGNWDDAQRLYTQAQRDWERYHGLTASVADHSPMDELDMLLAEISVFAREQETVHFASTCRSAAKMAQAMAQAQTLTWWNLL